MVTYGLPITTGEWITLLKMNNMKREKNSRADGESCVNSFTAVEDALYVIGGKWRLPIIARLLGGDKRFTEIQRTVKGISAKVLSHELKELELNGFVIRILHGERPIVEYRLTEYCRTLKKVVHALDEWGRNHLQKIKRQ
jgi:DNA-binding HxlR family transcriptional regulator